jgi:cell division protein FtsB
MQKEEERLTACDKSDTIRMINKRAATLCRQNKKIKELEEQTKVLKAELEVAEATVEEYRNEIERLERVNLVEDNEAPGQKVREKEH